MSIATWRNALRGSRLEATMELRDDLLIAAGDFIHDGTIVAFARMPDTLTCVATLLHGGRGTQVWDATVRRADGRPIGHFRCTQYLLEAER